MSNFRDVDRQTPFLLPPSVDEWLPEKHQALDLRVLSGSHRGSGSASYHPSMLLGLLVYGYATGVFSSRKLERSPRAHTTTRCAGWRWRGSRAIQCPGA